MRIFLSYASQDKETAKEIYLALRDQGHKVFFDRADLPPGEEYHNRIREAIQTAQLFIFLMTPDAVDGAVIHSPNWTLRRRRASNCCR